MGISGDCSLPNLGISTEDRNLLISNVSMIFKYIEGYEFLSHIRIFLIERFFL